MRPTFLREAIVLAAALIILPVASSAQSNEAKVRRLDSLWAHSYAAHDTMTAKALFADNIQVTAASGARKDKEGELGDVRPTPGLTMRSFRTSGVTLREEGGRVIVDGTASWEFNFRGALRSQKRQYTATYAPGGSLGWQMVALQMRAAP